MSDLIKRLRAHVSPAWGSAKAVMHEAADALEQQAEATKMWAHEVANGLFIERELRIEIERLRGIVPEVLEKLNDELCAENAELRKGLENCRLYAARHRKEEWAKTILRFCEGAGVKGSPLRAAKAGKK